MKVFAFAASLQKASSNKKLIRLAAEAARAKGAEVDLADFQEFDMPLYNNDIETGAGFPKGAQELARRLKEADAFMIATPEYNWSIPGTLKNAIDWVSRMRPSPFWGKTGMLLASSNGAVGGARVLTALRPPLEVNGAFLIPRSFSLPNAQNAFDAEGRFADHETQKRLESTIAFFISAAEKLRA